MKDSGTGYVIPSVTYTKFADVFRASDFGIAPEGFVPVDKTETTVEA
jgi:hypothetical protein